MAEWEEWSTEELEAAIARLDKESEELTEAAKQSRADHPAGLPSTLEGEAEPALEGEGVKRIGRGRDTDWHGLRIFGLVD